MLEEMTLPDDAYDDHAVDYISELICDYLAATTGRCVSSLSFSIKVQYELEDEEEDEV